MNSSSDLGYVRETFSFAPEGLVRRAESFRQGETLVAGKITPQPVLGRFGPRIAQEGGDDVPSTWTRPHGQEA